MAVLSTVRLSPARSGLHNAWPGVRYLAGALRNLDSARLAFFACALAAALVPLTARSPGSGANVAGFPGWPAQYEGRTLRPLPLTAREASFVRDFPGKVGRFSDGRREIIMRWLAAPTRRLHPAADCFKGSGYTIKPLPLSTDASNTPMACFRATRDGEAMRVCESIRSDHGRNWPDASSWYWDAMVGRTQGPWWSIVVGEQSFSVKTDAMTRTNAP